MTQAAVPSQSELTAEELAQVRAAMWRRIEEDMQKNQCVAPVSSPAASLRRKCLAKMAQSATADKIERTG